MLVQFTVKNFLSFKEETTFSMVGIDSDHSHESHLIFNPCAKNQSLVRISSIYGANAAGKSNLIEAISFAQDLIIEGTRSGKSIPITTYKLGAQSKIPSKFEFIFIHRNTQYSYGFKLNSSQILEEWLYVVPDGKKREVMYFERITTEQKETTVKYGASFRGKKKDNEQFLNFIAQGTRPNQLFLTEAEDRNVSTISPVFEWFEDVLTIIPAEAHFNGLEVVMFQDKNFTKFLSNILKHVGTGIESIAMEEVELDFERYLPEIPKDVKEKILADFEEERGNAFVMISTPANRHYLLKKSDDEQLSLILLTTQHLNEDGELISFEMREESDGTQRLINLVPILFMLQEKPEKVIFIDELDRRLHTLLSRQFLEMVLTCSSEDNNNQLIFTTHDTNLLDLEFLRRDEIWFVEKNNRGVSSLYSLAEFKIRPDLKIEKGYLNGRFGAIPFFGDLNSLGWLKCDDESDIKQHSFSHN
jgi:uncharacterized protein